MKKTLIAGLAGLSLTFAAGAALAESADTAPAPAAHVAPSVDTTPIVDLVDNPATKAVLETHLPGVAEHPSYEMFKSMTLRQVEPMSEGVIDDEKLAALQADLDKLGH